MKLLTLFLAVLLAAACGPGQSQPEGRPTGPDLQTPVPEASGFPADPVLPTPQGPGETFPPGSPPSAAPTT